MAEVEIKTKDDVTPEFLTGVNPETTIIVGIPDEYKLKLESYGFNIIVKTNQNIGLETRPFAGTTSIPITCYAPLKLSLPVSVYPLYLKPGYVSNLGVKNKENYSCRVEDADEEIRNIIYTNYELSIIYDVAAATHFGRKRTGLIRDDELFTLEFGLRWNAKRPNIKKIIIFIDKVIYSNFENLF